MTRGGRETPSPAGNGNSWCSLRALGSDVDPLRCREMATRDFYREPAMPRTCFPWEGKVWPGAGSEGSSVKIQGNI